MKLLLTTLCTTLLVVTGFGGFAQSSPQPEKPDTAGAHINSVRAKMTNDLSVPKPDDEFNAVLLVVGIAFVCIVIGATLAGAAAATLLLLLLFALVSAGIISAGVLTGLYRKSLAAGFTTVLVLISSFTTMVGGAICFWLINRIFHIDLTSSTALLLGAFSGLIGGLLLGYVLAGIIRLFINYCRQKLSF
jgi:hypothetical protein